MEVAGDRRAGIAGAGRPPTSVSVVSATICPASHAVSPVRTLPAARPVRVAALVAALIAGASAIVSTPATAQQPLPPITSQPLPPPGGAPPPAAPKAPPKTTAAPAPKTGGGAGDGALRQRVEALEAQLTDALVAVGTLESLVRSGAVAAAPAFRDGGGAAAGGGVDAARLAGLETQVRTLTQQVQQLSDQVRALGGQPGAASAPGSAGWGAAPAAPGVGGRPLPPVTAAPAPPPAPPPGPRFSATGAAGWGGAQSDGIEALPPIAGAGPPPVTAGQGVGQQGVGQGDAYRPPAVGAAAGPAAGTAKETYEAAYQLLLQQDYDGAETAFTDFLARFPNDTLAGNAQFWLGEAHFVRGQYKAAAGAFLKGTQTYARSPKAPDSLLKLGMSLGRLGQTDEACATLAEVAMRYPRATADVKTRVASERQRVGCPP
jgi:tol-pal system protein YbgF